ncbi:MAG: hypothetical protein JXA94_02275 [Parachlamydiales bacterium]|nr:hypothetical protein [Parachlamydiales bacterium]
MISRIVLYGESEKGKFNYPYLCKSLDDLCLTFGNPPENSEGLNFAIQSLMYGNEVIFFRVKEEGFSFEDYFVSINFLMQKNKAFKNLTAIGLPKVGSPEVINAFLDVSKILNSILIISEKDLFDYLIAS